MVRLILPARVCRGRSDIRRRTATLVTVMAVLVITGCAPDDEGARSDLEEGAHVGNSLPGSWGEEPAWSLQEELRVGAAVGSGKPEEEFGSVASVVSNSKGEILVLDWQAQAIRVFAEDGSFSHQIGRRGEGPGEFLGAWDIEIGKGDTITVLDDGNMRYSVFAPDGSFVRSRPRDIVGYGTPRRARLRDGSYLDWGIRAPDGRAGARVEFLPVRYTPDLERADTFPAIRFTRDMADDGRVPLMNFEASMVAAVDAEGAIWFGRSPEYRIFKRTLAGDTTLAFSLEAEGAALREADRENVRERWADRPDIRGPQLDALPETRPILRGILPDNRGHVLVFADVAGVAPGSIVDVFRENGEYLGRLSLPEPVQFSTSQPPVAHVTSDHIYLVVRDEFDVPYVQRLRLVKG